MATKKTTGKTSVEVEAKNVKTSNIEAMNGVKPLKLKKTNATTEAKENNTSFTKKEVIEAKAKVVKKDKKTVSTDVLAKKDYNPIDEVLEKKAKNEEKKVASLSKKENKIKAKAYAKAVKEEIKEKGNKIKVSGVNRRCEIKENVMKAEVKKFIAQREDNYKQESASVSVWSSFVNGYKNIFNFKGRTSRYEFWSFVLVNFLFCLALVAGIICVADLIGELATGCITLLFGLIEMIVYLSLAVRRIHDTGYFAWKGFFRPAVCSFVVYFCALMYLSFILDGKNILKLDNLLLPGCLSIVALLGVFTYMYYAIKIFIVAGFIEEDAKENNFGTPKTLDGEKKCKLISIIVSYFLICIASYFTFSTLAVLASLSKGLGY